jgi:hypothetical protein
MKTEHTHEAEEKELSAADHLQMIAEHLDNEPYECDRADVIREIEDVREKVKAYHARAQRIEAALRVIIATIDNDDHLSDVASGTSLGLAVNTARAALAS